MIAVTGFTHLGGVHHATAILRQLLTFHGIEHPQTNAPLSEALCFGLAGGIGVGYSFCPSIVRHGRGSGVSIIGRYQLYGTDGSWYQTPLERLGLSVRLTETTGQGKAFQNLLAELNAGRPTVVWCDRASLPYLFEPADTIGYYMYSLLVHGVDETAGTALVSERAATPMTVPLSVLAESRNRICSQKNRTLALESGTTPTLDRLRSGVLAGLRDCVTELRSGKMKTFSLPGLEQWAKMVNNSSNKDGWHKVFADGTFAWALLDVYRSIHVNSGSQLFRLLFVQTLMEAGVLLDRPALMEVAKDYARLGQAWSELADAALPESIKPFKQAAKLVMDREKLLLDKGEKALTKMQDVSDELTALEQQWKSRDPLKKVERTSIATDLQERITNIHRDETAAAERLRIALG